MPVPFPSPPPVPADLPPDQADAYLARKAEAYLLRNRSTACYLIDVMSSGAGVVSPDGHVEYVAEILAAAGDPRDPLERLLVEQALLAHHTVARLFVEAAKSTRSDAVKVRLDAAARLLGELRRCVLAVAEYRERSGNCRSTLRAPNPEPASVDQEPCEPPALPASQIAAPCPGEKPLDGKLGSNEALDEPAAPKPQPEARGGRPAQPRQARPSDGRRPRAAASRGPAAPAVAALDGPQDAGGQAEGGPERPKAATRRVVHAAAASGGPGSPNPSGTNGSLPPAAAGSTPVSQVPSGRLDGPWPRLVAIRQQLIDSMPVVLPRPLEPTAPAGQEAEPEPRPRPKRPKSQPRATKALASASR